MRAQPALCPRSLKLEKLQHKLKCWFKANRGQQQTCSRLCLKQAYQRGKTRSAISSINKHANCLMTQWNNFQLKVGEDETNGVKVYKFERDMPMNPNQAKLNVIDAKQNIKFIVSITASAVPRVV